eukprot:gnl/MRDRNA2_/MRDRNA2_89248_c0_seq1.p1 gnl/MRDRNA2_/MRDRNA2_89248_c0~~gnl/MRDRNA2_/MRDRNA2_89248_c0_seq1.p1  ORF type:complete len:214 (-),score=69.93 gnl/MRDRNA2_/MRDRNA2_89248_c0_seq1:269-910(-)
MQAMLLTGEQNIEAKLASKFQEHLELMQLKDELLMNPLKAKFRAPPGLEDQLKVWTSQDMHKKIAGDHDDETTDAGSGSDREGDSSEDESSFKFSANAPEFHLKGFGKLSADAAAFDPMPKLSADAPVFSPTPLRTGLKSTAKLFVPGGTKTQLTKDAGLFVPHGAYAAPKPDRTAKAKTQLALVTTKSDLFVPAWPELNASVEMKKQVKRSQ